jgi:hypothetical protein
MHYLAYQVSCTQGQGPTHTSYSCPTWGRGSLPIAIIQTDVDLGQSVLVAGHTAARDIIGRTGDRQLARRHAALRAALTAAHTALQRSTARFLAVIAALARFAVASALWQTAKVGTRPHGQYTPSNLTLL